MVFHVTFLETAMGQPPPHDDIPTRPAGSAAPRGAAADLPLNPGVDSGRIAEENRRLYEAGRMLTRSLEPAEVVRTLRRLIAESLPCDGVVVSSYAADERLIRCRYAWVEGEEVDPGRFPPVPLNPEGRGMQSHVIATHEPLRVDDVEAYTRQPGTRYYYVDADGTVHNQPTEQEHSHSALMVPLLLEGQVTGVLQVLCNRPRAYDAHDLRYLEALAAAMAAADRNATLYARARDELEHRRRAEAELRTSEARARELAETLERRVTERTAELRESHAQMVDFSYSVSHDLRSPLRAIRGYLDTLVEELGSGASDTMRGYAARIAEATDRMDRLIRELLAYSRLGRIELAHEPVALGRCVREALTAAETELTERGAIVHNQVDEEGPVVLAHAQALTQAIWNLVHNAAKFVAEGTPPVVTLRTEERGDRARLWVEDNGIGIAPEHSSRIFRVFERLHAIERYPGLGIGLAMVRRAVDRMEGHVGLESEPGRGSRFWIELPLAVTRVEADAGSA
jgi:signal transduction histidine kinase